jgi:poly-gamma-glutamate capsule biosynthesis protein CapA/YwtB (metallophosphatase superfamily)
MVVTPLRTNSRQFVCKSIMPCFLASAFMISEPLPVSIKLLIVVSISIISAIAVLAQNLKEAGFDLLTTANNHCLDKGIKGLNNTLTCLDEAGLLHVGTARNQEEKETLVYTEIEGVKIAFLAYTYGANGLNPPRGKEFAVNFLEEEQIFNDLEKARTEGAKLIVLYLHFGQEYHEYPDSMQIHLAQTFLNAGADIILGSHPHVLQLSQSYKSENGKTQFVIYSLGNFISDQNGLARKASVILHLHFGVDALTEEPYFKEATYDPIWTRKYKKEGRLTFEVLPLEQTLAQIRKAEADDFTIKEIQELEQAWLHISSYMKS